MTDWIALPNKFGMFAVRKDQVLGFHDVAPGTAEGSDEVTPRIRLTVKDSMPRIVPMSALDFAQLMGVVPPTEELVNDLKPCVLVPLPVFKTVISDPETVLGGPRLGSLPDRDYSELRARLKELPFLQNDTIARKIAEDKAYQWVNHHPDRGRRPGRPSRDCWGDSQWKSSEPRE